MTNRIPPRLHGFEVAHRPWRENRHEAASGRFVPLLADEDAISLPDGAAELVAMINLHHELADPAATYREALRLLVPGGQLLVVDWAPHETPKGPPLAVRASEHAIRELLLEIGFAEVRAHEGLPRHWLITARTP